MACAVGSLVPGFMQAIWSYTYIIPCQLSECGNVSECFCEDCAPIDKDSYLGLSSRGAMWVVSGAVEKE
jgi:hypothetical protein